MSSFRPKSSLVFGEGNPMQSCQIQRLMNGMSSDGPNAKGLSRKQCVSCLEPQKLITKEHI